MHFASSLRKQSTPATIAAIRKLEPFDAANLHADRSAYLDTFNRLPKVWRDDFLADHRRIRYVIRSWITPIAWFVEGEGWVYPPVPYSSYTSRQQELVRAAITGERTVPRHEHLLIAIDWEWEAAA